MTVFSRWPTMADSDLKSRGESILVRTTTPWLVQDQSSDDEGRPWFVKGTLGSSLVTLVNFYLPNLCQVDFLEPIL